MNMESAIVLPFTPPPPSRGFSGRELIALLDWAGITGKRLVIEAGVPDGEEHQGAFALIYTEDESWSSVTVGRDRGSILLWDSRTNQNLGRFRTIQAALDHLLGQEEETDGLPGAVIPFHRAADASLTLQS